ncbi:MAG: MFS transporter, partial [Betaproteobacteria bacterium]|nr:MFS transporter [Betaproteobacteria bacterium]
MSDGNSPRNTRGARTLKTCCGAHIVHDGFADVSYVLLPLLAQTFGLNLTQVGMIRTAHRVAMAAFQIPAGLIAERFGERNLLALGTLISGLAFIALGFANGYWMILIALFFAGMGSAVQHPLASTIISHAYPGEGRRTALGTYNFAGDIGKFVFGGIVSLAVLMGLSWQAPVVGFGIAGIATAVVIFWFIANTRTPAQTKAKPKIQGWGIRNKPAFAALCLVDMLDSTTRTVFLTFIAFLLIARGVPEGWAALAVPLVLVGGMAGKYFCGVLAERLGVIRTIVLTEAATGIGVLLTLVLPGIATFILLPLVGVVLQGTSSVIYGTIGDLAEQDKLSRAFGIVYTVGAVCGLAAPLIFGVLGDAIGIEKAIFIAGVTVLLTLPLAWVLRA